MYISMGCSENNFSRILHTHTFTCTYTYTDTYTYTHKTPAASAFCVWAIITFRAESFCTTKSQKHN